jgi:hypothetical protein
LFPSICGDLIASLTNADPKLDNYDRYDVLAGHDPAGTSVLNMRHWKQFVMTGEYKKFDYGKDENMK